MAADAESIDPESVVSGRAHANPGAKLLDAARDLFYRQGYHEAGVNELIARSGTSKKSFYRYYPAKRELGQAYLAVQQQEFIDYLDRLMQRYRSDYRGFARTWAFTMRKAATGGDYCGCPFSNLLAQTGNEFAGDIAGLMADWRERLCAYLAGSDLELAPEQVQSLASGILMQYQGAIHMWRLSGELAYFERFEAALLQLAGMQSNLRKDAAE